MDYGSLRTCLYIVRHALLLVVARKFILARDANRKLKLENPEDSIQLLSKKFILHDKLHLIKMQRVPTIPVYFIDVIYIVKYTRPSYRSNSRTPSSISIHVLSVHVNAWAVHRMREINFNKFLIVEFPRAQKIFRMRVTQRDNGISWFSPCHYTELEGLKKSLIKKYYCNLLLF